MSPQQRVAYVAALAEWARASTLFAFDFDGTLAPIVANPANAHVPADNLQWLQIFSARAHVCVISGRARADLLHRLPALDYVVGNHGNEGLPAPFGTQSMAAPDHSEICRGWIEQLHLPAWRTGDLVGAVIENKGATLSIHYRHCADPARAHAELMMRVATLTPSPRLIGGLLVLNLLPLAAWTKREALQALMEHSGCERAVFVGDDLTDERVFEEAPDHWLCIRVGPCASTHARFVIDGPAAVTDLLARLTLMLPSNPRGVGLHCG